jgi:hypothetical protein
MTALNSRQPSSVVGIAFVKTVTLTLDTSIYASGDVLADLTQVTDMVRADGAAILIQSVTVLDKDAQGIEMDLVISPYAKSLGTLNAGVSISDADAEGLQRIANIASTDYASLGSGSKIATKSGIGLMVQAAAGSSKLYIGAITRGTPTHTAAGIVLQIGYAAA